MGRKATEITHGLKQYSVRRNGSGTMEDGLNRLQANAYNKGRDDGRKETTILVGAVAGLGTLVSALIRLAENAPKIEKSLLSIKEKLTKSKENQELPEASESDTDENPAQEDKHVSKETTETPD